MDLLQELTNLTKDDTLVLAALKNIFDCYNVSWCGRWLRFDSWLPQSGRREIDKRVANLRSTRDNGSQIGAQTKGRHSHSRHRDI
jgi:hypothetical protein